MQKVALLEHSANWGVAGNVAREVSRAWILKSLVDSTTVTTFEGLRHGGKKTKPYECIKKNLFHPKNKSYFLFLERPIIFKYSFILNFSV